MNRRVVFDTNVVLSALLFSTGKLSWLRLHWREGGCLPLLSRATAAELTRVLAYPRFRLSPDDRLELLTDFLPYCQTIDIVERCPLVCRDVKDQPFLDLAQSGGAGLLVTGDRDLLALVGQARFSIITTEAYRNRVSDSSE